MRISAAVPFDGRSEKQRSTAQDLFCAGVAMAVLAESRGDNVVTISAVKSLKMMALSVVWGSWVVIKNAVARVVSPLWPVGGGSVAADDGGAARAASARGGKADDKRLAAVRSHRDRPPPCLSTTVYGTHSYVKVKV